MEVRGSDGGVAETGRKRSLFGLDTRSNGCAFMLIYQVLRISLYYSRCIVHSVNLIAFLISMSLHNAPSQTD